MVTLRACAKGTSLVCFKEHSFQRALTPYTGCKYIRTADLASNVNDENIPLYMGILYIIS